jgi:hypothetical protein
MQFAATLGLSTLPLVLAGVVTLSRPTPPVPINPVQTETVRVVRMDVQTFRARWLPVNDMPPTILKGRDAPLVPTSAPVAVDAKPPPPAARIVRRASLRPTDICARHGQRKVTYTVRGYQHWRCRR